MSTATQKQQSLVPNAQASIRRAPSVKYQPRSKRYYFDVGLGSVCLSGRDTGGAYCLLEVRLAPGIGVPRHTPLFSRAQVLAPAKRTEALFHRSNGTDLTDAFTGRWARGIRNRLTNEFRHGSSPPLPFPVQHALTQTVATPASAQGALELMTDVNQLVYGSSPIHYCAVSSINEGSI